MLISCFIHSILCCPVIKFKPLLF